MVYIGRYVIGHFVMQLKKMCLGLLLKPNRRVIGHKTQPCLFAEERLFGGNSMDHAQQHTEVECVMVYRRGQCVGVNLGQ